MVEQCPRPVGMHSALQALGLFNATLGCVECIAAFMGIVTNFSVTHPPYPANHSFRTCQTFSS